MPRNARHVNISNRIQTALLAVQQRRIENILRDRKNAYRRKVAPAILILTSIVLMGLFGYIATNRSLTEVEVIAFQFLSLFTALVGSYIFGRQTSKNNVKEMVEPYARSAFRRLISLFQSISRVAAIIEGDGNDSSKIQIIRAITIEQISTANDALADWQDIVPESVEELRREMQISEQ